MDDTQLKFQIIIVSHVLMPEVHFSSRSAAPPFSLLHLVGCFYSFARSLRVKAREVSALEVATGYLQ